MLPAPDVPSLVVGSVGCLGDRGDITWMSTVLNPLSDVIVINVAPGNAVV